MNFDYNKHLEPQNFVDCVDFTKEDPCIWNVYPAGAAGDLTAAIINFHYGNAGCDYYGINDKGQVIFRPTDYKLTNNKQQQGQVLFDQQHFFDISESLGHRNLNYSIMDQVIFSCHMYHHNEINEILSTFPQAKVINTYIADQAGKQLIDFLANLKNFNNQADASRLSVDAVYSSQPFEHPRVLNIPFGSMFNSDSYYKTYDKIVNFLNLNGRLICYDYIQYYLSKQHPDVQEKLVEYSKTL